MTADAHPELAYWQALAIHALVWAWPLYDLDPARQARCSASALQLATCAQQRLCAVPACLPAATCPA